jgi:16S rRNA (uracil1498-N3)-methyltransferase
VFIPPDSHRGSELSLPPAEAHYIRHVLRLRAGEEVTAFDGAGWTARASLRSLNGKSGVLTVIEERRATRPPHGFSIAQAILKAPAMDLVVQACTELGASAIVGFASERSVPRDAGVSPGDTRVERWRRIAIEACRQCGREFAPEVTVLADADSRAAFFRLHDTVLVACLREDSIPLGTLLERSEGEGASRILLIVGPEGDLTPAELDVLVAQGARPCRLAKAVLRAETATCAGAAILAQHLLMRMSG